MDTEAEELGQRPGCGSSELLTCAVSSDVSYIHLHVETEALFTLLLILTNKVILVESKSDEVFLSQLLFPVFSLTPVVLDLSKELVQGF